jgi:Family of unknown function (DUF5819)
VTTGASSVQERIEASPGGRFAISVLVVVILFTVFTANLTNSKLRSELLRVDHYILYGAGFDQSWSVFAPDPRRETIAFEARIRYSDGGFGRWRIPLSDNVFGAYWDYRWRKWTEYVVQGSRTIQLAQPAAIWLARHHVSGGRRPQLVQFVRLWYDLRPPGQRIHGPPRWHEYHYYDLAITPEMLAGVEPR